MLLEVTDSVLLLRSLAGAAAGCHAAWAGLRMSGVSIVAYTVIIC